MKIYILELEQADTEHTVTQYSMTIFPNLKLLEEKQRHNLDVKGLLKGSAYYTPTNKYHLISRLDCK